MKKLRLFNWEYLVGKNPFEEGGNCLVFQPVNRCFKIMAGVGNGSYIYYWQSKGLSNKKINYYGTETKVEFN